MAGGNTKSICLYELKHRILIKKFQISQNRSLDGILPKLNSKNIKDGINKSEINDFSDSDYEARKDKSLPGARNFDVTKRNVKLRVECRDIKFSPAEDNWIVSCSEGLMVFSQNSKQLFIPTELDENITLTSIMQAYE